METPSKVMLLINSPENAFTWTLSIFLFAMVIDLNDEVKNTWGEWGHKDLSNCRFMVDSSVGTLSFNTLCSSTNSSIFGDMKLLMLEKLSAWWSISVHFQLQQILTEYPPWMTWKSVDKRWLCHFRFITSSRNIRFWRDGTFRQSELRTVIHLEVLKFSGISKTMEGFLK